MHNFINILKKVVKYSIYLTAFISIVKMTIETFENINGTKTDDNKLNS
jgi:hypothetical protein